MAKKSKLARCSGAGEDRLSSLPDDILINSILSLLPTLEAQRTSVLSRRWRYLCLYVPCLDLDCSQKVPDNPITDKISAAAAASKYAEWVDRTIDVYRGTAALRHFRVLFHLGNTYAGKIYSWLAFSLRQGVEAVEIDCTCTYNAEQRYRFRPIEPALFPNLRLLKSLTLKTVYMPDDSLNGLLSACEFLERLHLSHVAALEHVNVTAPVLRLKHIHIDSCWNLISLRIHAPTPDLVSFTYPVEIEKLALKHAPRLVNLQIRVFINWAVHPLFRYLSQLESLHLIYFPLDMEDKIDPLRGFPVLSRLKHLKIDFDGSKGREFLSKKLRFLASLPEIAPFLQHLTVEVGLLKSSVLELELAKLRLQLPVRVLEIEGFKGFVDTDCQPALRLVRACPSLEKLIIGQRNTFIGIRLPHPYEEYYEFSRKGLQRYEFSEGRRKIWERHVKRVIEPELPSKAKLVLI